MSSQSLLYRDYCKREIPKLIKKTGIQVKGWEQTEDEGKLFRILCALEQKMKEQRPEVPELFKEAV